MITILSLCVALLAVFVGPILAWLSARRQMTTSLVVANKQIIAPMRQAWINNLRDSTAELTSRAFHYYRAGYENRSDAEYQAMTLLEQKISLMLNVTEADHREFEDAIRTMVSSLEVGSGGLASVSFPDAYKRTRTLARAIFKREWNRIKEPIEAANSASI